MNLLFCINKGYLRHLATCLNSITRFPSANGWDVYILHSDMDNTDLRLLDELTHYRCRLHSTMVEPQLFAGFPESKRYPRQIYYRILAAQLLPEHLERVLYLDADLVVINPLTSLYERDFDGSWYIACTHVRQLLTAINNLRLGSPEQTPYINSGVMLMNLAELRRHQDQQDVIRYVEQNGYRLILPDQDIISALYGDKIQLADSLIYNLGEKLLLMQNARALTDPDEQPIDLDWIRANSVIIHYCGKSKPWNPNYRGKLDVFYHEAVKQQN